MHIKAMARVPYRNSTIRGTTAGQSVFSKFKMKAFIFLVFAAVCEVTFGKAIKATPIQATIVEKVLHHAPRNARLIGFRSSGVMSAEKITGSLVSNYTTIRDHNLIKGGFSCVDKVYGYYADVDNDCQIFHICVPMHQLFPKNYDKRDIMEFSFICPRYTTFSQPDMVCVWERSAIPCSLAPQLYHLNNNFFVIPSDKDNSTDISKI